MRDMTEEFSISELDEVNSGEQKTECIPGLKHEQLRQLHFGSRSIFSTHPTIVGSNRVTSSRIAQPRYLEVVVKMELSCVVRVKMMY